MKTFHKNLILLLVVALIAIVPLFVKAGSEFGGADGQAEDIIAEINPDYEPWAEPLWEPPGTETESLLFALQGVFGAGIIGYCFGYMKGKGNPKNAHY